MRVLVTGASGFIGGFLVHRLVEQGHEVICLLRKTSARDHLPLEQIRLHIGSLHDVDSLCLALEQVEVVFHLAGAVRAVRKSEFYTINAKGTENLLLACDRAAGGTLKRFVLVSSLAAAGPCIEGRPLTEADPPRPVSDYGRSKLEAEKIAWQYANRFPVTVLRPPIVYGPRDRDVYQYFRQVRAGVALKLGRRERLFSLIHVQDLVRGIEMAATAPNAAGNTYFLCNPEPASWDRLGNLIARSLNAHPVHFVVPECMVYPIAAISEAAARIRRKPALLNFDKIREMKESCWVCSPEKAGQDFGFRTEYTLETGIKQTAEWYIEHGWL